MSRLSTEQRQEMIIDEAIKIIHDQVLRIYSAFSKEGIFIQMYVDHAF